MFTSKEVMGGIEKITVNCETVKIEVEGGYE